MDKEQKRIAELEKRVAALEKATQPENIKKLAHDNLTEFFEWCADHPCNSDTQG